MPAERFDFTNAQGERLAGLLDNPPGEPRAYALFAPVSPAARTFMRLAALPKG